MTAWFQNSATKLRSHKTLRLTNRAPSTSVRDWSCARRADAANAARRLTDSHFKDQENRLCNLLQTFLMPLSGEDCHRLQAPAQSTVACALLPTRQTAPYCTARAAHIYHRQSQPCSWGNPILSRESSVSEIYRSNVVNP